ncbi:MAG: hypothetical protein GX127_04770 [Eubacteriaceae bacterium]|jgi:hypothetical protein|nr:hypothetical protein [Eubacteriaceae bacterium]
MNKEEMLAYRKKLFSDVVNHQTPDRVPLCPFVETWVFHYSGISIKDAFLKDNKLLFNAIKKFADDVPVDAVASISNTVPFKMGKNFGGGIYTVNDDGVQIIGSGGRIMEDGELLELAKDVKTFFANTLAPRKFPIFNQSLEKNVDLIKKAIKDMVDWGAYNGEVVGRIEQELGLPVIIKATNYMPMDVILDYLRDFVGISSDVRRVPDEIYAASESLLDFVMDMYLESNLPEDDRWLFSPLHYPTYMRPKDFQKLYLPFMKKYIEEFGVKRGYTLHFFMENDWMPYLDILQELPTGAKVIGLFEIGHAREIKEKLKGRMVYQGGLAASDLKFREKDEIADIVKKTFDELAPGGGFIYGTEYSMMNMNDGKPENFIEAMTVAKEYGKY